ncbi:hypothetical protein Poly30_50200 [Planctomycetes bacterium Poly30]|uniref:Cytochrome c domain-containing protein n=1 Tax=Saltatorellus ferox TaxID=2528018 RepID=A0A518EZD4_9BACT|nr:hypothetical protein Poly30_50200 [Planctomycetes bacterium Poly30]
MNRLRSASIALRRLLQAVCIGFLPFAVAASATSAPQIALPSHIGGVHGTIGVSDPGGPPPKYIPLPGHTLMLRDKVTGVLVDQVVSDVYGRYYFTPKALGTYELSWPAAAGWAAGVYPDDIVIDKGTVNPKLILLTRRPGYSVAVGTITLSDGSTPGLVDEYFGIESTPDVRVEAAGGALVSGPVRANADGTYAIAYRAKGVRRLRLQATIEGTAAAVAIGIPFGGMLRRDLMLPNAPPEVTSLHLANALGTGVRRAATGDVLVTQDDVSDPNGDPVSILWKAGQPSAAPLVTQIGNQTTWTIPNTPGTSRLYAVVMDGRGGYRKRSVSVTINKPIELFSGTLRNKTTGDPIQGGRVDVNGRQTFSEANGSWSLQVPVADDYLMSIYHADYALAGMRSDRGSVGRVWNMVPRKAEWIEPRLESRIIDDRVELQQSGRRGATVVLPADTMVDPAGNLPQGPLRVSLATLDLGDNEAVANWAARTPQGITGLISYGVISIEVTDSQGREYQVRPGGEALVSIPIMGLMPGDEIPEGAPQEIPIWSYIEEDGFWRETGRATLNRDQALYEGFVTHFSEINLDVTGADSAIRVLCDPSLLGMYLRVSDVPGDGIDYTNVKEGPLDSPLSVIWLVPPSQLVRLEVLTGPGGTVVSDVVIDRFDSANPAAGHIQQTSPDVLAGPSSVPVYPAYPYTDAPITVTIKWQAAPNPFFLHFKGVGNAADATDYFNLMNVAGNRGTLEDWWATNGFGIDGTVTPGAGEQYARTSFENHNDLGSGRDMHLYSRADGTKVAWVQNYGDFNQDHGNADLAALQFFGGATVCMEYSPMENASGDYVDASGALVNPADPAAVEAASVTKFFVFAEADTLPGTEFQISADLDGYGQKFVPNLCLNCHGGSASAPYTGPGDGQLNAYFRELDYETYHFPFGAPGPSAAEKAAFKTQNEIVYGSGSSLVSSAAIKEVIDIWYQGGALDVDQDDCIPIVGGVDPASIPSGWHYPANLEFDKFYCDVIAESCRTCHVAHDGIPFNTIANFDDSGFMEFYLNYYVSTTPSTGTMPHALITYRNFWLSESPFRPQSVLDFLLNNNL